MTTTMYGNGRLRSVVRPEDGSLRLLSDAFVAVQKGESMWAAYLVEDLCGHVNEAKIKWVQLSDPAHVTGIVNPEVSSVPKFSVLCELWTGVPRRMYDDPDGRHGEMQVVDVETLRLRGRRGPLEPFVRKYELMAIRMYSSTWLCQTLQNVCSFDQKCRVKWLRVPRSTGGTTTLNDDGVGEILASSILWKVDTEIINQKPAEGEIKNAEDFPHEELFYEKGTFLAVLKEGFLGFYRTEENVCAHLSDIDVSSLVGMKRDDKDHLFRIVDCCFATIRTDSVICSVDIVASDGGDAGELLKLSQTQMVRVRHYLRKKGMILPASDPFLGANVSGVGQTIEASPQASSVESDGSNIETTDKTKTPRAPTSTSPSRPLHKDSDGEVDPVAIKSDRLRQLKMDTVVVSQKQSFFAPRLSFPYELKDQPAIAVNGGTEKPKPKTKLQRELKKLEWDLVPGGRSKRFLHHNLPRPLGPSWPAGVQKRENPNVLFRKNEYLAVRNCENGFWLSIVQQNFLKRKKLVKIKWLNLDEGRKEEDVYHVDRDDVVNKDTVICSVELEKVDRNLFKLPEAMKKKVLDGLKLALETEDADELTNNAKEIAAAGSEVSEGEEGGESAFKKRRVDGKVAEAEDSESESGTESGSVSISMSISDSESESEPEPEPEPVFSAAGSGSGNDGRKAVERLIGVDAEEGNPNGEEQRSEVDGRAGEKSPGGNARASPRSPSQN